MDRKFKLSNPSGAKAASLLISGGTAEPVPFHKTIYAIDSESSKLITVEHLSKSLGDFIAVRMGSNGRR
jgi:hypothetical protein